MILMREALVNKELYFHLNDRLSVMLCFDASGLAIQAKSAKFFLKTVI